MCVEFIVYKTDQGAFCVKFTPKIRDCTPTFIINYIMIFETPRRRYANFCAWNAPWKTEHCLIFEGYLGIFIITHG